MKHDLKSEITVPAWVLILKLTVILGLSSLLLMAAWEHVPNTLSV